jgi:hypothetical protein
VVSEVATKGSEETVTGATVGATACVVGLVGVFVELVVGRDELLGTDGERVPDGPDGETGSGSNLTG